MRREFGSGFSSTERTLTTPIFCITGHGRWRLDGGSLRRERVGLLSKPERDDTQQLLHLQTPPLHLRQQGVQPRGCYGTKSTGGAIVGGRRIFLRDQHHDFPNVFLQSSSFDCQQQTLDAFPWSHFRHRQKAHVPLAVPRGRQLARAGPARPANTVATLDAFLHTPSRHRQKAHVPRATLGAGPLGDVTRKPRPAYFVVSRPVPATWAINTVETTQFGLQRPETCFNHSSGRGRARRPPIRRRNRSSEVASSPFSRSIRFERTKRTCAPATEAEFEQGISALPRSILTGTT